MAVPVPLDGSECWTLTTQQVSGIETAEMRLLRALAGYRLIDKETK
jgi:hypothetical protein